MQGLASDIAVGHDAFGGVAVEFDVDVGERQRRSDQVRARLERETPEPATPRRRLADPAKRVAQRAAIRRQRAVHHQAGLVGDGAVECELQGGCGDADLQSGSFAGQRGEEVVDADASVDARATPVELPGGGERT